MTNVSFFYTFVSGSNWIPTALVGQKCGITLYPTEQSIHFMLLVAGTHLRQILCNKQSSKGCREKCNKQRYLRHFTCREWTVKRCEMSSAKPVQLWHKETSWWWWCVSFVLWTRQVFPRDDHIPAPTVTDVGLNSNKGRLKCCLQVDKIRKGTEDSARDIARIFMLKVVHSFVVSQNLERACYVLGCVQLKYYCFRVCTICDLCLSVVVKAQE